MKAFLLLAASLCVGSANAALVDSVTAGAFTFQNIQCSTGGIEGICSSLAVSASQSGSGATLTITDGGAYGTPNIIVSLSYDVVYTSSAPLGYLQSSTSTRFFLGNLPETFFLRDTDSNGATIYYFQGLLPSPAQEVTDPNGPFSTFHVEDGIFLVGPAAGASPGAFSTSYSIVPAPEPASFALILLTALLGVAGGVLRWLGVSCVRTKPHEPNSPYCRRVASTKSSNPTFSAVPGCFSNPVKSTFDKPTSRQLGFSLAKGPMKGRRTDGR